MEFRDRTQITEVAHRVATLISRDPDIEHLRGFLAAYRTLAGLDDWFRLNSVQWLVIRSAADQALLPAATARRLLDPDGREDRRCLFTAVIEALSNREWHPDCSAEQVRELATLAGQGV